MDKAIVPFLKWAGGKRWFTNKHSNLFPKRYNRYIEPFLGGGSVYFYLRPDKALIGDANAELVMTYQSIKENWSMVYELLSIHQDNHCEEYYYFIRNSMPEDQFKRAARLIYLNRTCFNGIYRVNRHGVFNVPKGTKNSVLLSSDDFEGISNLLSTADICNEDFEVLINNATKGDLLFADPPYTVRHNQNGFIKYNENLFSWNDQVRLADSLYNVRTKGVQIISTNANHHSVRELYQDRGFDIRTVSRYSSISADPERRNQFEELVIYANI